MGTTYTYVKANDYKVKKGPFKNTFMIRVGKRNFYSLGDFDKHYVYSVVKQNGVEKRILYAVLKKAEHLGMQDAEHLQYVINHIMECENSVFDGIAL